MSEKYLLTIDEAAEYFNIGKNKLRDMIKEPCCNFVLFNGKKALIKKNRLESYLDETVYLWLQETEVCDKISAIKNNIYAPLVNKRWKNGKKFKRKGIGKRHYTKKKRGVSWKVSRPFWRQKIRLWYNGERSKSEAGRGGTKRTKAVKYCWWKNNIGWVVRKMDAGL